MIPPFAPGQFSAAFLLCLVSPTVETLCHSGINLDLSGVDFPGTLPAFPLWISAVPAALTPLFYWTAPEPNNTHSIIIITCIGNKIFP